ncbi:MAG: polysaccharide biosynthesis/export family protein, partial [Prevotella sp.]|nr:polysaccharide biosynthesis/export family protein [Prevotella sp.]
MRRFVLFLLLVILAGGQSFAQSGMTDQQVTAYILEESDKGTSQSEIVTRLMQRGVTVQQLQRVKRKYEQQKKQGNLGSVENSEDRLRTNNAQQQTLKNANTGISSNNSSLRIQGSQNVRHTYDEDDPEYMLMQAEMGGMLPVDSIALLEQILEQQRKEKTRIFGHDIFNNENLSFEPNMNIATPRDYRLGPGDVVIVDIYG